MSEKNFIGEKEVLSPSSPTKSELSAETKRGLEELGAFAGYTSLKVELANDGLTSEKRKELLQQLNEEEKKLIDQGLIPSDRKHDALIRSMSDAELEASIDYLNSLDPNPLSGETRLQALLRMESKNPITEEQKRVRTLLEKERAEREFIRSQLRDRSKERDKAAQAIKKPISVETPQEEWAIINRLKNPSLIRKDYEQALGDESAAAKAVEKAIKEQSHTEAAEYWKLHQEDIAEKFREESDGGISKMAQQIVEGIPVKEEGTQSLGMVLFLTFRAMKGINEEEAVQLTGETIAHGHLKGIGKTTIEKPEMDAALRTARDHLSNLGNPKMLDRYGLASAKKLYQSVQYCVEKL